MDDDKLTAREQVREAHNILNDVKKTINYSSYAAMLVSKAKYYNQKAELFKSIDLTFRIVNISVVGLILTVFVRVLWDWGKDVLQWFGLIG